MEANSGYDLKNFMMYSYIYTTSLGEETFTKILVI